MTFRTRIAALVLPLVLAACGGGGGGGGGTSNAPPPPNLLTVSDVEKIVAQAITEAQAQGAKATIAVVDRVGNPLAVYTMTGASSTTTITSGTGAVGGLEGVAVPSTFAAISMAVTGAYLSSSGNAFTSRTASQIVQDHFNPNENRQPGGPLFGVQFSQLTCSDLITTPTSSTIGPKAAPLGLSAEPGGLPLYKNGVVVGGVGVMATGTYSLDLDILNTDTNVNELVAVAGTFGFAAPSGVRADRITVDGRTLRYVDSEAVKSNPAAAPVFSSIPPTVGSLTATPLGGSPIVSGTAFGTPASGFRADVNPAFSGTGAFVLVDSADVNRYPPRAGTDGLLTAAEVTQILKSAIEVANRARGQIRQPLGSSAQVTISVVDTSGVVLGLIRTPDAPIFGTDVSLQKARTAAFFSSVTAAAALSGLPPAMFPSGAVSIAAFVPATRGFLNDPNAFANGIAYGNRGIGNLARPYFPDGITGANAGPLSVAPPNWSIFNVGLQLDLVFNEIANALQLKLNKGCAGQTPDALRLANGIQIFPGSVPIFRGNQLVGAIGVSGDGIDQDDMVSFLGLANAGQILNTGIANAPAAIRNDNIVPQGEGTRLRYVNCPQAPFNGSNDQNVCAGF